MACYEDFLTQSPFNNFLQVFCAPLKEEAVNLFNINRASFFSDQKLNNIITEAFIAHWRLDFFSYDDARIFIEDLFILRRQTGSFNFVLSMSKKLFAAEQSLIIQRHPGSLQLKIINPSVHLIKYFTTTNEEMFYINDQGDRYVSMASMATNNFSDWLLDFLSLFLCSGTTISAITVEHQSTSFVLKRTLRKQEQPAPSLKENPYGKHYL